MKIVRISITLVAGADVTFNGVMPAHAEGFALAVKCDCPDTAAATYTLNLYDVDGGLVFTKANILENVVTMVHARAENKEIVCIAGAVVSVTFNVAPNVNNALSLTFYAI